MDELRRYLGSELATAARRGRGADEMSMIALFIIKTVAGLTNDDLEGLMSRRACVVREPLAALDDDRRG